MSNDTAAECVRRLREAGVECGKPVAVRDGRRTHRIDVGNGLSVSVKFSGKSRGEQRWASFTDTVLRIDVDSGGYENHNTVHPAQSFKRLKSGDFNWPRIIEDVQKKLAWRAQKARQDAAAKSGREQARAAMDEAENEFGVMLDARPTVTGNVDVAFHGVTPAQYASLLKWAVGEGLATKKEAAPDA